MKTKLHLLIFSLIITFSGFSQSAEKIKGSRNVTTQITEIDVFNHLVISDNFKINVKQGNLSSVEVNADDNLHDILQFNVQEGRLSIKTKKRITSKKKMEITVIFKDSLNSIELKENAALTTLSPIKAKNLELKTKESSKAYLTIEAETFIYIGAGKSKAELNITSNKNTSIDLSDNSNLKILIETLDLKINMLQRSNAKIDGSTDNTNVSLDNSSVLKAEGLISKTSNLLIQGKADAYLEALNNLIIEASGTTETYIYGSPKIEILKFEDEAILRKK